MQYFPLFFLTLCILLATAHAQASNEVVVKVGRTKSLAGSLASISKLLDPGFQIWLNALENQGGVNIGGVKYVFRMQEYNDASDEELMAILYERLITVDKVNFMFLPPFIVNGLATLASMAEASGIITINLNALGTFLLGIPEPQWIFSTYPPINLSPQVCGRTLLNAGAKTFIIAVVEGSIEQLQNFFDARFRELGMTNLRMDVITKDMIEDPMKLDPLIKEWKASGADVWMGGGIFEDNIPLLNRIRHLRYEPKSLFLWAAPDVRSSLPAWQLEGVLFSSNFDASLEFPDAWYGTAANYSATAVALTNTTGASVDSVVAISGEIIVEAVRRAGSANPSAVRTAMLQTDITTMLGQAIFTNDTLSLSLSFYCFQGEGGKTVGLRPSLNTSFARDIVYPVPFSYAPGFFSKNNHKKVVIIAVTASLGSLLLLGLIGLGGYLYFRSRFHLVLVQRGATTEEWS